MMPTGLRVLLTTFVATTCTLTMATRDAARAQTVDPACRTVNRAADFGGPDADLPRLLQLYDSANSASSFVLRRTGSAYIVDACRAPASLRRLARALGSGVSEPVVRPFPAEVLAVANSAYPRDWHDGALWAGRGLNIAGTAGLELRWRFLSLALAPVVTWQANAQFDMAPQDRSGFSPYVRRWFGDMIDAPQRFGDAPFAAIHPGRSFLRADVAGIAAGISTENMTWGPALRNPIMLSATAPGFAHMFVETARPLNLYVAALEFQLFWGLLEESDFFDDDPDNDRRVLAGLLLSVQPYVLEGLHLGISRMHAQTWWPERTLDDLLIGPYLNVRENLPGRAGDNQLLALFFRWAVPRARMDVYGEWAREDHWGTSVELLRNLDASQGWTLGLQKLVEVRSSTLRLGAEVTHLSDALPVLFAGRGLIPFYSHTAVIQGHTHRGQWLGAPIGTGAESQALFADYFWTHGRSSMSIERARYDDDAYNVYYASHYGPHARDTELSLRAGHLAAFGRVAAHAELGWSRRYNRSLLGLDSLETARPYRRDDNVSVRLSARWNPW